jgi:hypothetical protein
MIRTASIEAFHDIKERGLLSKRRLQVYEILCMNGPLVGSEIARLVKEKYGAWCESETIRNRLTEMRDQGFVCEVGKAIDPKNGRNVILWEIAARVPEDKRVKRKSVKRERLAEICEWALKILSEDGSAHAPFAKIYLEEINALSA